MCEINLQVSELQVQETLILFNKETLQRMLSRHAKETKTHKAIR